MTQPSARKRKPNTQSLLGMRGALQEIITESAPIANPYYHAVLDSCDFIDELIEKGYRYDRISAMLMDHGVQISTVTLRKYHQLIKEKQGAKRKPKRNQRDTQDSIRQKPIHRTRGGGEPLEQGQQPVQMPSLHNSGDKEHLHSEAQRLLPTVLSPAAEGLPGQDSEAPLSRKERMAKLRQQQQENPNSVKAQPLIPVVDGEVIET